QAHPTHSRLWTCMAKSQKHRHHTVSVLPEAQLPADHLGSEVCPAIIAHRAPVSIVVNFHPAFAGAAAAGQPERALCRGCEKERAALRRGEKKQPTHVCGYSKYKRSLLPNILICQGRIHFSLSTLPEQNRGNTTESASDLLSASTSNSPCGSHIWKLSCGPPGHGLGTAGHSQGTLSS
uniref:Uncharacterized protein n=1 Tax=Zonotrichia albicollis TaxID=44394 RepID=A0A8D2N4J4_ZONAL